MTTIPGKMTPEAFEFFKREYEAGLMSNCMIARTIGRSEAWVRQWAAKLGLEKDKMVPARFITNPTSEDGRSSILESDLNKGIADHKANVTVEILRQHSQSLGQFRNVVDQLGQELAILSSYPEEMRRICEIVAHAQFPDDEDAGKVTERIKMYEKMLTLQSRAPVMNSLVNSLTKLIESERKNVGLDKEVGPHGNGVEGLNGVAAESLLAHVLANKEALTVNLQINNYSGERDAKVQDQ